MARQLFFLAAVLFHFTCFCQKIKIDDLLKIKPSYTRKLDASVNMPNTIRLRMDFNSPIILNPEDVNFIKDVSVLKVELYYTAFQLSETFSQPKLNRERLQNLQKIFPGLFNQSFVTWEFKGQNDCKNEQIARGYFHGFVITYIPKPSEETTHREVASLKTIVTSDSLGYDSVYTVYKTRLKKKRYKTGSYLPTSKRKKEMGIVYDTKGLFKRRKMQYAVKIDTVRTGVQYHKFVRGKNAMAFVKRNLADSTIFAVLRRNEKWNNIAFVCDVTGSMSAYTTQLLVWYKLNSLNNKVNYFTFFNDGDNKSEWKKRIGKTGGIYHINAGNYEAVELMIQSAMMAGSGGDAPENNCEALLETIRQKPDAKEFVMIADNFANIKDIELLKSISKPVHIIICGTGNFMVNTDYLDLARATKGSVHSIEQDIDNLVNIHEGQTIEFDGKKYILRKGKFEQLTSL